MEPIGQTAAASTATPASASAPRERAPFSLRSLRVLLALIRFAACVIAAGLFVAAGNNLVVIEGQSDFAAFYHGMGVVSYGLAALSIGLGLSTR